MKTIKENIITVVMNVKNMSLLFKNTILYNSASKTLDHDQKLGFKT